MSTSLAVMLAAGRGLRLGEASDTMPKCLVPVGGRSILDRACAALVQTGIRRLVVVTGYRASDIAEALEQDGHGLSVRMVYSEDWETTNNVVSLDCASEHIDADFLLLESDVVFDAAALGSMTEGCCAAVDRFLPDMDGTVVTLSPGGCVRSFYLKGDPGRPRNPEVLYKTVNLYRLEKETYHEAIAPRIRTLVDNGQSHVYYERAFAQATADVAVNFAAASFEGYRWSEVDDRKDLKRTEKLFGS